MAHRRAALQRTPRTVIIIALGGSVVALGVSAAGETLTPEVVAAAVLGVVVISAMWWLYFDIVAVVAERRLSALSGAAQAAMARDSYSYIHLLMVFGIVLTALGLKKTLLDIGEPLKVIPAVALFGGVALYLLAHIAFRMRNYGSLNTQRLVVAIVLLALIPAALVLSAQVSLTILAAILITPRRLRVAALQEHAGMPSAVTTESCRRSQSPADCASRCGRICSATAAPSPTAAASCFVEPARTSPAAKMPGTLDSIIRLVVTKPTGSRSTRPSSQPVLGSRPMNTKTPLAA
ncbi:MAG: low temperature requirement protein A [Gemmatimonadetes bacterium]|nr:low temperature requirement protein A [Gemmatimonadota bacterium]